MNHTVRSIGERCRKLPSFRFLAALALNLGFLLLTLLIVNIGFEANDDLTLAAFVDGQMARTSIYIPYINIALACLMKGIYTLLGQGIAWHTIGQFVLMLAGFVSISWVLFGRVGYKRGTAVSLIMLLFFGVDVYACISYTKTAAVCTVGGMLLLIYAMEDIPKEERKLPVVLGVILCVFGFMLRPMEFLPCFGLTAVLCLRWLWNLLFTDKAAAKEKLRKLITYAAPFVLVLAISGGLWAVNELAWSRQPWKDYHEFDAVRVAYSDYGRPEYREMPEEYDALGISETAAELLYGGNYFDPDAFGKDTMQSISDAREAKFPAKSIGECLGVLLDKCVGGFFIHLPVYACVLVLLLWFAAGSHQLRDWLTLIGTLGLFALLYIYLIYRGRYLVDRVDAGLFLALTAAAAFMLEKKKLCRERLLTALCLLLAVFTSCYMTRSNFRANRTVDRTEAKAAVNALLADSEHIYLAKLDTVDDTVYSPFEPAGKGYWDRIILLGGWDCNHPAIMANLALYGVENPYRDIVNNERVYIIDDDIDLTLSHIRERYCATAGAELAADISVKTGLDIYKIYG